jgi:iron complex transport system substrate-binding protein
MNLYGDLIHLSLYIEVIVKKTTLFIFLCLLISVSLIAAGNTETAPAENEASLITITDGLGRELSVPANPDYVICSGSGALRLCTYLQGEEKVIAVDDMETRRPKFDARPYALANPQFKDLPTFGEFRGHDNPELIVALDPQPQVILKTYAGMGTDPEELQSRTGIPVVVLNYGDLGGYREDFYASLRIMGKVLDKSERAEEIISFVDTTIKDLNVRSETIPEENKKSCFVGGIAHRGPHGIRSTEPAYPPFMFLQARNPAHDPNKGYADLQHSDIAKEQLLDWDPEIIFVDISTMQTDGEGNAIRELTDDPVYRTLKAVQQKQVYGVLPYNWYTSNHGSTLANAYFIGTILYPEEFSDIDPAQKADEIYTFLVGKPVFSQLNNSFADVGFSRIFD